MTGLPPASVSEPAPPGVDSAPADAREFALRRRAALQGKTLEIVTQVGLITLLPRLLGPAPFGRLMLAIAVVTVGTALISLGAPSAFARFLPAEPPERRSAVARAMTLRLLKVRAGQLALAAVLGLLLLLSVPERVTPLDLALVYVALVLEVAAMLAAQIALGMGRTWIWSFRLVARNIGFLVAVPVLFAITGPVGVLLGVVVGAAVGAAFAGVAIRGLVRHTGSRADIPPGSDRYGIITGLSAVLSQLTYRGPVLAAALLAGSAVETGYAGLAGGIAMAAMFAVREIFTVSLPELVERWDRDRAQARHVLDRIGWRAEWVLIAGALAGALMLERALPLVAGESYAGAVGALLPVLALLPLLPAAAVAAQMAALALKPERAFAMYAVGLVAFAATAVWLVPAWGARGASLALLVAVAVSGGVAAVIFPEAVKPRLLVLGLAGAAAVLRVG
ncbi:MAG TPA: oligosaccharide flippase family protein [Gemmatimonadaceae bacterium]